MRLIYEPRVYPVVKLTIDEDVIHAFLDDEGITNWSPRMGDQSGGDGQFVAEMAGRLCYDFAKPRPGGNKAYLDHIKEVGHGSVLEHANWCFIFTGISRSLSHELVRHRAGWGFSQLSQRYVDSKDVAMVVPVELQDEVRAAEGYRAWVARYKETSNEEINDVIEAEFYKHHPEEGLLAVTTGNLWIAGREADLREYNSHTEYLFDKIERQVLVENGVQTRTLTAEVKTEIRKRASQTARSCLPNAAETKMFVTGNARAFRHFIEQRGSKFAESEIRQLAYKVWQILVREASNVFGDYEWVLSGPESTGGRPMDVNTRTRKV